MNKRGPKNIPSDKIHEIRTLYATKEYTQKQLSNLFKISQSTVCKIINQVIHKDKSGIKIGGEAEVRIGYKAN